jgi:hypothetical protein
LDHIDPGIEQGCVVPSEAALKLTIGNFKAMQETASAGKPIGRTEVLRRSINAYMNSPRLGAPHPGFRAPFTIVGEGAQSSSRQSTCWRSGYVTHVDQRHLLDRSIACAGVC